MKTTITIVCFLCFCLFFINCNNKKIYDVSDTSNLKIIDIDQVQEEDHILLSEFFSHVKTIILETGDDILLGKINGIQVYNDLIFILDTQQDIGIYIFNRDGKFIRKIGKKGNGPGEYLAVSDFTIDQDNDNIYLLDCDANKIYKYRITGEFEGSITLENKNIQSFHLQYNKGNLYADVNYIFETQNGYGYMIQEIDATTGKQKASWLDSYKYNKNWNGALQRSNESLFYSRNQESFKFVHFFMNTIISFSEDSVKTVFVLKDKDWITQKDVIQIKEDRDNNWGAISFENLFKQGIAFNINNYMEWGDFISFQYQKKYDSFFVLHNVKTQKTRVTAILIDDLVYKKPTLSCYLACADSNGLYGIMKEGQLLHFIEHVKEEGFLSPDLDKINELKNIPEDSNPVIFFYEF